MAKDTTATVYNYLYLVTDETLSRDKRCVFKISLNGKPQIINHFEVKGFVGGGGAAQFACLVGEVQPKALLVGKVQPKTLLVGEVHPKALLVGMASYLGV